MSFAVGECSARSLKERRTEHVPPPRGPTAEAPEIGTLATFAFGLLGLGFLRRRAAKAA